jgi:hypothetical protein
MSIIPFDALISGASGRCVTIENKQFMPICDVFKFISGASPKTCSKKWERMSPEQKEELVEFCCQYKFPGQGQSEQTVIDFQGAVKLAMFISGDNAVVIRSAMVDLVARYYAGDGTLIDEIEDNAASTSAVNEMARSAVASGEAVEKPKKRPRVTVETFSNEVSIMLKGMESQITAPLRDIAAGQGNAVMVLRQVDARQENISNKLDKLTEELKAEKIINECNSKSLENFEHELREISGELTCRKDEIRRKELSISILYGTIRARDATIREKDAMHANAINEKDAMYVNIILAKDALLATTIREKDTLIVNIIVEKDALLATTINEKDALLADVTEKKDALLAKAKFPKSQIIIQKLDMLLARN